MEEVICVVEDVQAATGMYTATDTWAINIYDMFFTNKRIIMAVIYPPSNIRTAYTGSSEALAAAINLLNIGKIKKLSREQFKGRTLDEILSLHRESFEIPYESVKSVKLSKSIITKKGILEITAPWRGQEKKLRFSIPKNRLEDVKEVINKYLSK